MGLFTFISSLCVIGFGSLAFAQADHEAPLTLFRPDGIRVLVTFDGHEEVCYLDTGSPFTIVGRDSFYSKYKKRSVSPTVSAANRFAVTSEITIQKVGIWGTERSAQNLLLSDSSDFSPVFGRCILGLDLLKDNSIVFDFKAKALRLTDNTPKDVKKHELKFSPQGHLLIPLKLDRKEVTAIWDTGFTATTLAPDLVAANSAIFSFINEFDSGKDFAGNPISYKAYRTNKVRILDLNGPAEMPVASFDMSRGLYKDLGVKAFIGFRMITQYNWMIDLKGKRWAAWDY